MTDENPVQIRKFRRLLPAATIAAVLGVAGLVWWIASHNQETTDDAFIDVHMVRIAPQVAGRVLHVPADDNQAVKIGDVLLEIDPADYQAKLDQATADLGSAQGVLAQVKAQLNSANAAVAEAEAEITLAAANATNADTTLARNRLLIEKKVISQQTLEDSIALSKSNNATLDAAKKKKASAEAQVEVTQSQIASAEAAVKSSEAQVEQAQLNLSYTKIAAAQDGRVTQKNVTVGDYVQTGPNIMLSVPKDVWVTANFKETQLQRIRPNQPADIKIDAYPEHVFKGHVDSIVRGGGAAFSLLPPENATGNYIKIVQRVPVKIVFDEPLPDTIVLGPSMSVVPTIHVE